MFGAILDRGKDLELRKFIDIQGAIRFLFLHALYYQVMAVVMPCFSAGPGYTGRRHLGICTPARRRWSVLLAGSIALGQPGKYVKLRSTV